MDSEEEEGFYGAASYYSDDEYELEEIPSLADKEPSLAPLLASNDAPHPSQLAALLEISRKHEATISKVETDISTLETEICDVESTLRALRRRRGALWREKRVLCSETPQLRRVMSPIRRLPPEMIGEIFLYFTPVLKATPRYEWYPAKTDIPWYLGQICRYWRSVALSLRSLWSAFDFCPGRRSEGLAKTVIDVDWVFEAVKAAQSTGERDGRDLPLANGEEYRDFIRAADRKREQAACNQQDHEIWEERPKVPPRDLQWNRELTIEEKCEQHNRRRNFATAIKTERMLREQTLAAASFELSLQRAGPGSFSSRLMGRDFSPSIVVLFEAHIRCLHRLTRLVLVNIQVDLLHRLSQSSANGKQLRTLELVFTRTTALGPTCVWPPPLTELALENVDLSSHDGIPWAQLTKYSERECTWTHRNTDLEAGRRRRAAYSQLTSVVDLSIEGFKALGLEEGDHPVLLPKLERARFIFWNHDIFQIFDMPLLQDLRYSYAYHCAFWVDDEDYPDSAKNIPVPSSLSHLRTLRICGREMDSPTLGLGFRDILARAPELTEIFVGIPCVADDLVLNLLPSEDRPLLGSKLEVVGLAGVNDYPRLLELLQFRFGSDSKTTSRLRSFTLYEDEFHRQSLDKIAELSIFADFKAEGWSIQQYNGKAWDLYAKEQKTLDA